MRFPWQKRREQKAANLVQYANGVYFLGASGKTGTRIKSYVQGYKNCDTVFSCVNLIAQSALNVPWYVYRNVGDEVEEVEKHVLYDWMKEPGIGVDWKEFCERIYSYYLAAGNCYIKKNVGSQRKYGRVDVLMPHHVEIKFDRAAGVITSYDYNVNGMLLHFPPEEIVHVKTFNPDDPVYGLSVIEAVARQVDISQMGQEWTLSLLENEARPSGVLSTEAMLVEAQRDAIKKEFEQKYSGYENAGKPLVLEGGLKWQQLSITPKELEFLNSDRINTRKICAAYKVPPELLGDNENKTYSNVKEARKAIYQEAVIPMLERFKSSLNRSIVRDFDSSGTYFLDFDTAGIEALGEDMDALWTRTKDAMNVGLVTRNEAREAINYDALPGEDVLYEPIGATITLVSEAGQPRPEPETVPEEEDVEAEVEDDEDMENGPGEATAKAASTTQGKAQKPRLTHANAKGAGFWGDLERKGAKWESFHRRVRAREKGLQDIAEKFLRGQVERAMAVVRDATSLDTLVRWALLDKDAEAKRYEDATFKWYERSFTRAVSAGMRAAKGELMADEEKADRPFPPNWDQYLHDIILESGTKITETTVLKIMDAIDMAEAEDWTAGQLSQSVYDALETEKVWRARRIAHTESAKIENYGELAGYKESEFVEFKGWLCAKVEQSRIDHLDADAQYSDNPIRLDDLFIIGKDRMLAPGDGSNGAGAGQICNCLCTLYPSVGEV